MKRCNALSGLALLSALVLFPGSGHAGVESILGKWVAKAETPNGPLEVEIELKLDGNQLIGTMGAFQGSVPLSNIKFEEPILTVEAALGALNFRLSGTLKDGKFAGEWVQVGGEMKGTWSAERKAEPTAVTSESDVTGEWDSVAVTPNGDLKLRLDLKKEGEKLGGTISSEMGSLSLKTASFKDNNLQFEIEVEATTYRVEAALKEGRLSGKWSQLGSTDTGAWSATRKASAAAPAPAPSQAFASLAGGWNSIAVLPDGTNFPLAVTFIQEGETITGSIAGPDGNINVQNGKFTSNTLTFEIELMGAKYRVEATLANGKLTGKWSAPQGTDSGAWTAERKP